MRKGSTHSLDARSLMREARKNQLPPNKGKKFSEEWKIKLSNAHKGRKANENQKRALLEGGRAFNYIDGRSSNIAYRNWQKNRWHERNKNADGSHTFAEWENLKAQYNWTCPACHKKEPEIKLSLDHIIPLSKGGSNNIENIQPLCPSCNFKKHTKNTKY